MKIQHRLVCVTLAAITAASLALRAAGENTTSAPTPAAQPAPALSGVKAELGQQIEKIKTKIRSGVRTEEAFAEEIKGFDAILAAHKGEQRDDVAEVLLMKGMLYLEVFKNSEKGEAILKQLKADFSLTQPGRMVDGILAQLAAQKEAKKVQDSLVAGASFPDFDEKDINGKPLSIAKFKGKIVLVDFWATWCGPCVAELPNVLEAYKKYHDKGFEVIGISLDKDEAKFKAFIAEKGMSWPHYFDGLGWGSKLGQKYSIESIPATYLLDREGKIIAKGLRGPALLAELEKQLGK